MRIKCLQLFFGVLLFFCLAFLSVPEVKANSTAFFTQATSDTWLQSSPVQNIGILFKATYNSINRIDFWVYNIPYNWGGNNVPISICEVSAISSLTCLDTPVTVGTVSVTEAIEYDVIFANAYLTTPEHFYKINFYDSTSNLNLSGLSQGSDQINYASFFSSAGYNWNTAKGVLYYDPALEGPAMPTGKIYWAGVGTQFGQIGGYWEIPVYYNICSSYDLVKQAYLTIGASFTDGYTQVIADKDSFIGPQKCSGIAIIKSRVKQTVPYTGNMSINLVMIPYGLTDPVVESELPIASTTMPVIISTGQTDTNYLDYVMANPLTLTTTAGTTTQTFIYDFKNLAWSGGQVCLFNSVTSFVTNYCSSISTESGTSTLQFPNVTAPYQFKGQYVLYSSTTIPIFKSDQFIVNWVISHKPGEVVCEPPTLDLTHACDNFDITGDGITLGKLACGLVEGAQVAGFQLFVPGCASLKVFNDSFDVFKRAFPFNAFFDITTTIDTAIASSTDNATTTIGIPFINRNSTSTNKFYIVPVVSSSSMSNAIGTENKNTFRLTLGFIFWILGAVTVYFTVRKI